MNNTRFVLLPRPNHHQNQIQSHGYPSGNRNGYRPVKQLQPDLYALGTTSPDTIFPDVLVLRIAVKRNRGQVLYGYFIEKWAREKDVHSIFLFKK